MQPELAADRPAKALARWTLRWSPNALSRRLPAWLGAAIAGLVLVLAHRYVVDLPWQQTTPLMALDRLFALALAAGMLLLGWALGRRLLGLLRVPVATALEGAVFGSALGCGVIAYATFGLSLLGLLHAWLFLLLAAGAAVLLRVELRRNLNDLRAAGRVLRSPAWRVQPAPWVAGFAVVCAAMLLLIALLPPFLYDSLWYHLAAPQVFVQQHRFVALPQLGQANYPFTVEMLYAVGLLFGSDATSAVLEFAAGIGLLLATWALAARWFDRRVAWLAVVGLLTASDLNKLAVAADIDLALALFQFLALYAVLAWVDSRRTGWLVLGAVLSGLAAGTKYTALAALLPLALLVLSASGLTPRRLLSNWRPTALLVALAVLVASPWYIKNLMLYHNPLYPMLAGSLLDPSLLVAAPAGGPAPIRLSITSLLLFPLRVLRSGDNFSLTGRGLGDYLQLPLQVFVVGDREMYGHPSLLYLLAPLAFLAGRRAVIARLAVVAAVESVIWALGPQELRYLTPTFAMYALLGGLAFGYLAARLGRARRTRLYLVAPLVALLSFTLLEDAYLFVGMNPLPVLTGIESRDAFLGKEVTSYRPYQFLATVLRPGEQVLNIGEARRYYARVPLLPDNSGDMLARVFVDPNSPQATAALLERAHVRYILFNATDVQFQAHSGQQVAQRDADAFRRFQDRYLTQVYLTEDMRIYRFDSSSLSIRSEPPAAGRRASTPVAAMNDQLLAARSRR